MSKKLFIINLFLWVPSTVLGATSFELISDRNTLEMKGVCSMDVKAELYSGDNFESDPSYVATAPCVNDAFVLSDDLTRWAIPEGTYKLVVDGERSSIKDFTIKPIEMTKEEAVNRELLAKGLPSEIALSADQVFENAQASFGEKLYGLQLDLVTMQSSLKDTTYPEFIKTGLGGALSLVETTLAKLNEIFFVVEQRDFQESTKEEPATGTTDTVVPLVPSGETNTDTSTGTPTTESINPTPENPPVETSPGADEEPAL